MTERSMEGELQSFQDRFARALFGADADSACDEHFAGVIAQPGFAVYRNTVMKGCIDALQANYPSVNRLVGEEWFRAAAAIFARANPPRSPMLLDYGKGYAEFLAGFDPAAGLPYLAGVARLDRYWTEAHTARDEAPVAAAAVARLSPEQLAHTALRPHASARWTWFDAMPIATIWRRDREAHDADNVPELDWRAEGVLIVRPHHAVETIDLDAAGCAFLDACAAGDTLADAAAASLAIDGQTDLSQLMARLLDAGAFGSLEVRTEEEIR